MDDGLDVFEALIRLPSTEIGKTIIHVRAKIRRRGVMDSAVQAIDANDLVSARLERVDHMAADESRASGDDGFQTETAWETSTACEALIAAMRARFSRNHSTVLSIPSTTLTDGDRPMPDFAFSMLACRLTL